MIERRGEKGGLLEIAPSALQPERREIGGRDAAGPRALARTLGPHRLCRRMLHLKHIC